MRVEDDDEKRNGERECPCQQEPRRAIVDEEDGDQGGYVAGDGQGEEECEARCKTGIRPRRLLGGLGVWTFSAGTTAAAEAEADEDCAQCERGDQSADYDADCRCVVVIRVVMGMLFKDCRRAWLSNTDGRHLVYCWRRPRRRRQRRWSWLCVLCFSQITDAAERAGR